LIRVEPGVLIVGAVDEYARVFLAPHLEHKLYASIWKGQARRRVGGRTAVRQGAEAQVEFLLREVPLTLVFLQEQVYVGFVVRDTEIEVLVLALANLEYPSLGTIGQPVEEASVRIFDPPVPIFRCAVYLDGLL
jgi:hypothetical protein